MKAFSSTLSLEVFTKVFVLLSILMEFSLMMTMTNQSLIDDPLIKFDNFVSSILKHLLYKYFKLFNL